MSTDYLTYCQCIQDVKFAAGEVGEGSSMLFPPAAKGLWPSTVVSCERLDSVGSSRG